MNKNGCLWVPVIIFVLLAILYFTAGYENKEPLSQPFEITTDKGTVKMHLGMPKDSVLILLGEPDERSTRSYDNEIIDDFSYKTKKDIEYPDLHLRFENNILKEFDQN